MKGVSRKYLLGSREVIALNQVDLKIRSGEYVVVSGPSGSGKTTMLNIIGCIDYATEGRIHILDVPIEDYDESFRATFRLNNTGFIFQSYNLISTLTALENVMFPMQITDKPEEELEQDASELLKKVGLENRLDHLPWQLSSGEQQRVAIARAIANDPAIILADEPTANLDEESAEMVRQILDSLNKSGKTVIVMTHDEKIINNSEVRHLLIRDGSVISDD
ncbi:MAG: ATP-binding cassette domain-containing protein [Candidatus Lokiarchaeota archaeon]|nr:ATP-binding cassette domain-containing protein [Candidatus Lokiarchaeota archaeon]